VERNDNDRPRSLAVRISATALIAAVLQLVAIVAWLVQLQQTVRQNTTHLQEIHQRVDRIERTISERILEAVRENTQNNTRMQSQLEALAASIRRAEERMDKIVQALDSQYNQLQEHLRTHSR
jgi:predicted PurR-regulated permease PerM